MNKLTRLIAAVHASVLATGALAGGAVAQDSAEVKAYTKAIKAGTAGAIAGFLQAYPNSTLPGSTLGAEIAASVGGPTGSVSSVGGPTGSASSLAGASAGGSEGDLY